MGLELSVVIAELCRELSVATQVSEGEDLHIELGLVELELAMMAGKDAGPSAKLKLSVVEAGADASFSSQPAQRIKLGLDPRRAGVPPLPSRTLPPPSNRSRNEEQAEQTKK
jgi:hypothetical protein